MCDPLREAAFMAIAIEQVIDDFLKKMVIYSGGVV
jgi:hypothetical protein